MTICVRVRLSNTTMDFESPTLMSTCLTATSRLLFDGTFGAHADHTSGHDELARGCITELRQRLGELQRAAPPALLLPRVPLLLRGREHHARPHRLVVLEVLLGVQSTAAATAATATAAHPAGRLPPRSEPRFGRVGPQRMLRLE